MVHYKLVVGVGRLHSSTPIAPVGIEFDSERAANLALAFVHDQLGFDAVVIKDDEDADTESEEGGDGEVEPVTQAA